eukprot:634155-Prymnesium_polylepis.1
MNPYSRARELSPGHVPWSGTVSPVSLLSVSRCVCSFRVGAARERCATEIAAVVARVLAPAVLACVCRPLRSGVLATSSPPSSARSCPIATCASCVTPSCHP